MTKKHFKALAEKLLYLKENYSDEGQDIDFENFYNAIEEFCNEQNPNFDAKRFYNACHGLPYKK